MSGNSGAAVARGDGDRARPRRCRRGSCRQLRLRNRRRRRRRRWMLRRSRSSGGRGRARSGRFERWHDRTRGGHGTHAAAGSAAAPRVFLLGDGRGARFRHELITGRDCRSCCCAPRARSTALAVADAVVAAAALPDRTRDHGRQRADDTPESGKGSDGFDWWKENSELGLRRQRDTTCHSDSSCVMSQPRNVIQPVMS
jgi:hypothetical protein